MKYRHFTIEERESLQYMWWERKSMRSIAKTLNRSPSSISRELKRNFPIERQVYAPRVAHERALLKRKSRGRTDRLKDAIIRDYVIKHLKTGWSPEQIAGKLPDEHPECSISHEAIYQYIYAQVHREGHGILRLGCEDLRVYLKRRHKRRGQRGMRTVQRVFRPKGPSIDDRPAIVDGRNRIGDWESDSIASKDNAPGLNSLVERKTQTVDTTKTVEAMSTSEQMPALVRLMKRVIRTLALVLMPY